MTSSSAPATPRGNRSLQWRVVDIVTCAVIGIALGVVFLGWDYTGASLGEGLNALLPGASGLLLGVWLLGGLVGGFVIRKPGAAVIAEVIAALVEMIPGSPYGLKGVISGIVQGLGIEVVVAIFLYRRWSVQVALIAGGVAGALEWAAELIMYNSHATMAFNLAYLVACVLSGVVLTGLVGWLLVRALARTGALNQFAAGREARTTVA